MILLNDICSSKPYSQFKNYYLKALDKDQEYVNAVSIASYSKEKNIVDQRFVNLKEINNNKFIFYSNYDSPKASQFKSNNQISAVIFWSKINIQIRMRATINKLPIAYSKEYFKKRSKEKNALAISSNQSKVIGSYKEVETKYKKILNSENLSNLPSHWGGYFFIPNYFEFWEGQKFRLNKRRAFELIKNKWKSYYLEP